MADPLPPVPLPQALVRYVHPDGRLTSEGLQLMLALARRVNAIEPRLAALEP